MSEYEASTPPAARTVGMTPPLRQFRGGGDIAPTSVTYSVPLAALAPEPLCGVRGCVIHLKRWHVLNVTLRDEWIVHRDPGT